MKKIVFVTLIISINLPIFAEESWLIPIDSPLYRQAEELFICEGVVPPYAELPLVADDLKSYLKKLAAGTSDIERVKEISALDERIALGFPFIAPVLEMGMSVGYNSETGRFRNVPLLDGGSAPDPDNGLPVMNYIPFYEAAAMPSMLTAGFLAQFAGFSLLFAPELRETNFGLLEDGDFISVPEDFNQFDITNTPLVGIMNYFQPPFDIRFGRDKLHSGPGKYSTLSLNRMMPYYDHVRARFFVEGFSLSATVVSLNPVISTTESAYLDSFTGGSNPEPSGSANGDIFKDRLKTYINLNLVLRPWSWLQLAVTQTNLVGGRPIDFADFNPLIILHNNFDDGTYSCPILLSSTIVPFKGCKLYFEFIFYDAAAGDEILDPNTNPGGAGYMAGFTLLSSPFFDAGPGRFRLDFEFAYVDPYTYGKYYDLRKFTSRFTYIDAGPGRYWVDYPLGFYLGPDCIDFHASLSYGQPGDWEIEFEWQTTGQGEVDLYGYGDDTDYTTRPTTGPAPSGTAQWSHSARLSAYFKPLETLTITLWYRLMFVNNRFDPTARANIAGDNAVFHNAGFSLVWKIF